MMAKKTKKTRVEKLSNGKVKLSKENESALALVGKKPDNFSSDEVRMFCKAVAAEMMWLDENDKIA